MVLEPVILDKRIAYASAILLDEPTDSPAWPDWLVYDGNMPGPDFAGIQIVPSGFFDHDYGNADSLPAIPLKTIHSVPLLFGKPVVERHGNVLMVKADIIASAYFLLTRYEEWVRRDVRDEHGRFPGKQSLPYRAGFIDRPVVDEYSALLRKWAGQIGVELPAPKRKFSVLLTHDVDTLGARRNPLQPLRPIAGGLLGRRPWKQALRNAAVAAGFARDPYDNIEDVVRLDRRLADGCAENECKSIHFFMAGGSTQFDGAYDIRESKARNALQCVRTSGADVGLHTSYEAGQRPELIAGEHAALEKVAEVPISKNRHHFLTWREPENGHELTAVGITWDSTLSYADVAGFRLGVCRPVPLFDPACRCLLGIEEHPLIVMDCTLSNENYMNLDEEAAFDYVCRLADAVFRHQGEFVVLWHNTVLASTDTSYHKRLYPRVLDYLAQLLEPDKGAATIAGDAACV